MIQSQYRLKALVPREILEVKEWWVGSFLKWVTGKYSNYNKQYEACVPD